MSPYELITMIHKDTKITRQTIEVVNDLIAEIDNNPKQFIYKLSEELEDWCLKQNKCPLCSGAIVQIGKSEQPSEHFGQPVSETILKYGCDECNYIAY